MSTASRAALVHALFIVLCIQPSHLPPHAQDTADRFAAVPRGPALRISRDASRLTISGDASSAAHKALMEELAATLGPQLESSVELHLDHPTPPGWSLLTESALRAVGGTVTAQVRIDARIVDISGFVADRADWREAVRRLEASLLPGMVLQQRVTELDPDLDFDAECRRLLNAVTSGRRIRFEESSAVLRPGANALLDELVEILTDCPAVEVTVTGHTDTSGDAAFNLALSRSRADAVVEFLVGKGVLSTRLTAAGAGATAPLVEENNARDRARNRRIEFEFSAPSAGAPDSP